MIGDFATARADGEFGLVYLVFNTIGNLTTQAEQVACFRNAARHLERGGHFVIEVGVPGVLGLAAGDGDHWRRGFTPFRYVWPAELDLMAQLADLTLVERWGDGDRSSFSRASAKHISVWRKD